MAGERQLPCRPPLATENLAETELLCLWYQLVRFVGDVIVICL